MLISLLPLLLSTPQRKGPYSNVPMFQCPHGSPAVQRGHLDTGETCVGGKDWRRRPCTTYDKGKVCTAEIILPVELVHVILPRYLLDVVDANSWKIHRLASESAWSRGYSFYPTYELRLRLKKHPLVTSHTCWTELQTQIASAIISLFASAWMQLSSTISWKINLKANIFTCAKDGQWLCITKPRTRQHFWARKHDGVASNNRSCGTQLLPWNGWKLPTCILSSWEWHLDQFASVGLSSSFETNIHIYIQFMYIYIYFLLFIYDYVILCLNMIRWNHKFPHALQWQETVHQPHKSGINPTSPGSFICRATTSVANDTPKKVENTGWIGHMSGWTGPN